MGAVNVYKKMPEHFLKGYLGPSSGYGIFVALVDTNRGGSSPSVDDEYFRYSLTYDPIVHRQPVFGVVRSLGASWDVDGNEYTLRGANQYWQPETDWAGRSIVTHVVLAFGRTQDSLTPFAYLDGGSRDLGVGVQFSVVWPSQGILKVTLNHG